MVSECSRLSRIELAVAELSVRTLPHCSSSGTSDASSTSDSILAHHLSIDTASRISRKNNSSTSAFSLDTYDRCVYTSLTTCSPPPPPPPPAIIDDESAGVSPGASDDMIEPARKSKPNPVAGGGACAACSSSTATSSSSAPNTFVDDASRSSIAARSCAVSPPRSRNMFFTLLELLRSSISSASSPQRSYKRPLLLPFATATDPLAPAPLSSYPFCFDPAAAPVVAAADDDDGFRAPHFPRAPVLNKLVHADAAAAGCCWC
mmetsp:Transcript_2186/g.4903  ORF Transcript_2186/g.4903 Transcript_2186/m.4903 type:complete len:262 (+) Transcript_2186:2581-3366(+)